MGFFDRFPYTNYHMLNLDWIIDKVKECVDSMNSLKSSTDTKLSEQDKKIDNITAKLPTIVESEVQKLGDSGFFDETIERLFTNVSYLDTLKNKKILIFGDSISDNDFRSYNKWSYFLEKLAIDITGCEVKNVSTAGYQLSKVINNINSESGFSPDIIILFAGINDYRYNTPLGAPTEVNTTTFNGCLNTIRNTFKSKYPNAKVFYVSPLKNATTTNTLSKYVPLPLYIGCISERCKRFGWEFIDAYNNAPLLSTDSGYTKWYDSNDGTEYLHPSANYSPILCAFILGCLISGHGIPLSEVRETVSAETLTTMGLFSNTNTVFTPVKSGTQTYCVVSTNGFEMRVTYSIGSSSREVFASLGSLPSCLAPYLNKILTNASVTLTSAGSADTFPVMINNTGLIMAKGSNATALSGVSFTVSVAGLYYVENR